MKKKNLKSLSLGKESVSNLNKIQGGNATTTTITIDVVTTLITKVFSFCPHVSCVDCPPPLTEGKATCVRTYCNDLTCHTCV